MGDATREVDRLEQDRAPVLVRPVHPDAAEGVTSFLEKRPPEWKMRPSSDLPPQIDNLSEKS